MLILLKNAYFFNSFSNTGFFNKNYQNTGNIGKIC